MVSRTSTAFKPEALKKRPDFDSLSDEVFLRREQVLYYGVYNKCRSSLWRDIKLGNFPTPVKHGAISIWRVGDLRTWLKSLTFNQAKIGGGK